VKKIIRTSEAKKIIFKKCSLRRVFRFTSNDSLFKDRFDNDDGPLKKKNQSQVFVGILFCLKPSLTLSLPLSLSPSLLFSIKTCKSSDFDPKRKPLKLKFDLKSLKQN
jgi:hypothetical protein